jgi:HD-GYP domain-containing protein (c-di-GMP phosphodiesterase class II)
LRIVAGDNGSFNGVVKNMVMMGIGGQTLSVQQTKELERFGTTLNGLGVNFAVYGVDRGIVLLCQCEDFKSKAEQLNSIGQEVLQQWENKTCLEQQADCVWQFGDENVVLATVLRCGFAQTGGNQAVAVAMMDLGEASRAMPRWSEGQDAVRSRIAYFTEMVRLWAENFRISAKTDVQIEKIGTELAQTYEELVLLHRLSTNMRVTEDDSNFLQMACDCTTEIVPVEGIAMLVEKSVEDDVRLVVAAGSGLIDVDERMATVLHKRLVEQIAAGKEALLDSNVGGGFKYDWPRNFRSIIAVPLCGKDKPQVHSGGVNIPNVIGIMVAVNRVDKPDFDSIDVKLFDSVASSCAVFVENGRLFRDLKELLIGSLRALTSSIDAKDQYTRGHSERVAIISRWIAERLAAREALDEEQIYRIYLAGLLHDIGKIGIDESVLRKQGKLTEEEHQCIRRHPAIGAGILREIRQMRDIVPGVLYHHERMDGKGYPVGLAEDQVPLLGKIVGLADSFDAMTSKRTYRDAMPLDVALAEIEKCVGTQFDEKIARVFLESNVFELWEILQSSSVYAGTCEAGDFSKYGTTAVGALIR